MRRDHLGVLALGCSIALLAGSAACSGSDDTVPQKDVSPTTGTSTSSSSSSGSPSSSGAPNTSSGSDSSNGGNTSSGSADAAVDAPGGNCVPKGYAGNEKKIGMYCDDKVSCPFQLDPFLVCTHGHDPTGTHLFCTAPCSKDSECGSNAYCMKDPAGSGCVPTQCGGKPGS